MAPGSELRRALVLAGDDIAVASDYLRNLLGASGPDVDSRRQTAPFWQRAWNGLRPRERPATAIPQGDQLRRARVAVGAARQAIGDLMSRASGPGGDAVPPDLVGHLTAPELAAACDAFEHGGADGRVTASIVGETLRRLGIVAGEIGRTRLRLDMADHRSPTD